MLAKELKTKFLEFFKKKKHEIIPNASLIPENDPTVLFTTAGMHPLVPFLLGEEHPLGKRLVNVQICLRTDDIDEIGDPSHLTFFEMLGNWSLGDYFKKEAIEWSFEFLTKHLNFNPEDLLVSVFKGDKDAPRDDESAKIWQNLGIPKQRIYYLPKKENWWGPAGETGPCGPSTEIFIDTGKKKCSSKCIPGCSCGKYFEIWNDVFMEYNKTKQGKFVPLKQKNVDTGMGVERTVAILQGKKTVYETELFIPIINKIRSLSKNKDEKGERIVADHLKGATFILAEKILPSNLDRGYVLRRLIRRAIRYAHKLGIQTNFCSEITKIVVDIYKEDYPELGKNSKFIYDELEKEEQRFRKILEKGINISSSILDSKKPISKEKYEIIMKNPNRTEIFRQLYRKEKEKKDISKLLTEFRITKKELDGATLSGKDAFLLFQSYGFPIEMLIELVQQRNLFVDIEGFRKEFEKHQEISRKATKKKFRSGLADQSEKTIKLHTATHLLHTALKEVLGDMVNQRGSNITPERLRFDFSFDRKLTKEELKKIEDIVNEKIKQAIPVKKEEMGLGEAKEKGAIALFEGRYNTIVSVYTIGNVSKEVCTGPHVSNTKELGKFKIIKEESVAAGVRRIKAVLEDE